MDDLTFIEIYLDHYEKNLFAADAKKKIVEMRDMIARMEQEGGKLIFAGNGASAAIASHCALDFTKQAGVPSISFNDPSLITAFANDYGYEYWVAKVRSRINGESQYKKTFSLLHIFFNNFIRFC